MVRRLAPGAFAAAVAAALLLGSGGCDSRARLESKKLSQAQEAVKQFFAALPGGDCAVLGPLLVQPQAGADCPSVVGQLHRHGFGLVEVLEAKVDGRNPDAVIVRVRLQEKGRQREAPLLVERHPDGWKLRL